MDFELGIFLVSIVNSREEHNNCGGQYIFSFFLEYVAICCIITSEMANKPTTSSRTLQEYPESPESSTMTKYS